MLQLIDIPYRIVSIYVSHTVKSLKLAIYDHI
jgi:hypothetical protein